jgi:hypothetical protein
MPSPLRKSWNRSRQKWLGGPYPMCQIFAQALNRLPSHPFAPAPAALRGTVARG